MRQKQNTTSPSTFVIYYVLPLGLLILIFAGHFWLKNKDQRQIKKNLSHLIEALSFDSPPSMLVSAATSQTIVNALTSNAQIIPGHPFEPVSGRRELAQLFHLIHQRLQRLELDIQGLEVSVKADQQKAVAALTLKATATYSGDQEQEFREYQIDYVKEKGEWLIAKAQVRQTIQKPLL